MRKIRYIGAAAGMAVAALALTAAVAGPTILEVPLPR